MQIPVKIFSKIFNDEDDLVVEAEGKLDFDSGEIIAIKYLNHDVEKEGLPSKMEGYQSTSGLLRLQGKELEFAVEIEVDGGYAVNTDELQFIQRSATALVCGGTQESKKKGRPYKY